MYSERYLKHLIRNNQIAYYNFSDYANLFDMTEPEFIEECKRCFCELYPSVPDWSVIPANIWPGYLYS